MDGDQRSHVMGSVSAACAGHADCPVLVVGQDAAGRRDSRTTG
ncbi:universal stress protein [Arthrobacter sp. ov118]|nr:universal stress protein [Arthrobacter sp. ov118]